MKNNKGITLTSLMIYVIGMVIAIGVIATLTSYFYKNIDIKKLNGDSSTQFTNFSSVFSYEVNLENNRIIDCGTTQENGKKISYIIFSSGNQYTFKEENNSIYQNNIKICEYIEDCDFSYRLVNSRYEITVNFKTESLDLSGNNAIIYYLK